MTPDTLLWLYDELRRPGLPVFYTNTALPDFIGRGVLVEPPDEEASSLCWWREGGTEDVHFDVPWVLEIDLDVEEARTRLVAVLRERGIHVEDIASRERLELLAWQHAVRKEE